MQTELHHNTVTRQPAVDLSWSEIRSLHVPSPITEPDPQDHHSQIVDLVAENDSLRETLQAAIGRLASMIAQLERSSATIANLRADLAAARNGRAA